MLNLSKNGYVSFQLKDSSVLNTALATGFYQHQHSDEIKQSHLFQNRYENIYINDTKIPEIKTLLDFAIDFARPFIEGKSIKAGLWFNHMPPNAVTQPHTHDDYDEQLSGVYYIQVPKNSGNLLIHHREKNVEITPNEGLFVFFKPDVIHEVLTNHSLQNRLSVGINFGINND